MSFHKMSCLSFKHACPQQICLYGLEAGFVARYLFGRVTLMAKAIPKGFLWDIASAVRPSRGLFLFLHVQIFFVVYRVLMGRIFRLQLAEFLLDFIRLFGVSR